MSKTKRITKVKHPEYFSPPPRFVDTDPGNRLVDRGLMALSFVPFSDPRNGDTLYGLVRGFGSDEITYASRLVKAQMNADGVFKFDNTVPVDERWREDPRITPLDDDCIAEVRARDGFALDEALMPVTRPQGLKLALPRVGKFVFTNVLVDSRGTRVELGSTNDFTNFRDHGAVVPNLNPPARRIGLGYVDCKDVAIFPDGRHVKVRLKPGIQVLPLDFKTLLGFGVEGRELERNRFWQRFLQEYADGRNGHGYNPNFDCLHPLMPELKPFMRGWMDSLNKIVYGKGGLLESHPSYKKFQNVVIPSLELRPSFGTGPAPIRTERGWLSFPHIGMVLTRKAVNVNSRHEFLKLYCVPYVLHDLADPRKLVAVGRELFSTPNPENNVEMALAREPNAVPWVKICMGAAKVYFSGNPKNKRREPHIAVAVTVHDRKTSIQYVPERQLLDSMTPVK